MLQCRPSVCMSFTFCPSFSHSQTLGGIGPGKPGGDQELMPSGVSSHEWEQKLVGSWFSEIIYCHIIQRVVFYIPQDVFRGTEPTSSSQGPRQSTLLLSSLFCVLSHLSLQLSVVNSKVTHMGADICFMSCIGKKREFLTRQSHQRYLKSTSFDQSWAKKKFCLRKWN